MDFKTKIKAILETNFPGFKDEIIDNVVNLISDASITGDRHTIEKTRGEIDILLETREHVVGEDAEKAIDHAIHALKVEAAFVEYAARIPEDKKPFVHWVTCPGCGMELVVGPRNTIKQVYTEIITEDTDE